MINKLFLREVEKEYLKDIDVNKILFNILSKEFMSREKIKSNKITEKTLLIN